MKKLLNRKFARQLLDDAIELSKNENYKAKTDSYFSLNSILTHNHLTYKYILITAILAKATDKSVNALTLQEGSLLDGSYDARSFCHQVVVPFEREKLQNRLGGSNEPYLNKPARFADLSLSNAVRRGKDRETLGKLIEVLGSSEFSSKPFEFLSDALHIILTLPARKISMPEVTGKNFLSKNLLSEFMTELIEFSGEGETLTMFSAIYFELLRIHVCEDWDVRSHPVNQSGSSSRQVADIDIYHRTKDEFILLLEVKDKDFTFSDVEHAMSKCFENNIQNLRFITGPRASNVDPKMSNDAIEDYFNRRECNLSIVSYSDLINSLSVVFSPITAENFLDLTNKHIAIIKPKSQTLSFIEKLFLKVTLTS